MRWHLNKKQQILSVSDISIFYGHIDHHFFTLKVPYTEEKSHLIALI